MTFLNAVIQTGKLKRKIPLIKDEKLVNEIKKLEINLVEDIYSTIENTGNKLLQCRSLNDLKLLNKKHTDMFEAMMFLSFQYFRTKKMENQIQKSLKENRNEKIIKKGWFVIRYLMSTQLAKSLCLDKNIKFIFIENNTGESFMIGDQPVFNILAHIKDKKGNTKKLKLYYPITPNHSIIIHFQKNQSEKFILQKADSEMVKYLNTKVIKNSNFFVFSDNKLTFSKYPSIIT